MPQGWLPFCCAGGTERDARMLLARLPHVNGPGSVSEAKSAAVYDMMFKGAD